MPEEKNYPNQIFIQKSFGAESEPPIEIECYNGVVVLTQGDNFVSLSPESMNDLFELIKNLNVQRGL